MLVKGIVKSLVYRLGYISRYQARLLHRIRQNNLVPILSLHRVSPHPNLFWSPLPPAAFDGLLAYLKKHFEIITFRELSHKVTKKPKLILSFDDGYYDFIEYAMPILKKHGLKANQNIIPSQLLNQKPLWNIALYDFLHAAPISLIKEISFPGFDAKPFRGRKMDKIGIGLRISRVLKQLSFQQREAVMSELENRLFSKLNSYPITRMIHLQEMADVIKEHEIGVHSFSHDSMANETMDYFINDFEKCQDFFNTHQFPELDIYAFPNGSYRNEQVIYLHEHGIKYILLVDDNYAKQQSPYPRFNIAAFNRYEAIFQALGVKSKWK